MLLAACCHSSIPPSELRRATSGALEPYPIVVVAMAHPLVVAMADGPEQSGARLMAPSKAAPGFHLSPRARRPYGRRVGSKVVGR